MIPNSNIQAAIIAKLKANSALTAWLVARSSANEIREGQYQGAAFEYPAVRVQVGTQLPESETSVCYNETGQVTWTVESYTEGDSSQEADVLAGLVNDVLEGLVISGSGFRSLRILRDGETKAIRTGERAWRATSLYRAYVYQT